MYLIIITVLQIQILKFTDNWVSVPAIIHVCTRTYMIHCVHCVSMDYWCYTTQVWLYTWYIYVHILVGDSYPVPDGKIHLVGDSMTPYSGRLEISFHGLWMSMCGIFFDEGAANTACRQLGYTNVESFCTNAWWAIIICKYICCLHWFMRVSWRKCVCVCVRVWMCACVRAYICVYVFAYTFTYTQTHTSYMLLIHSCLQIFVQLISTQGYYINTMRQMFNWQPHLYENLFSYRIAWANPGT